MKLSCLGSFEAYIRNRTTHYGMNIRFKNCDLVCAVPDGIHTINIADRHYDFNITIEVRSSHAVRSDGMDCFNMLEFQDRKKGA